jgi:4-amino-4-deoxy-L-arabinose transferase-like glycosyltransferase
MANAEAGEISGAGVAGMLVVVTETELPWRPRGAAHAAPQSSPPLRLPGLLRGPDSSPAWYRPALLAVLLGTALLYLWDLSASGDANSFYAAAVQAGSLNWKAWFFGSLDSSNFITVDKPPGSLWVMGLSARIFGFNSWSLLVPSALEGVAAVALLAATVRRVAGHAAGLIAGAVLALTPAAVLMFRFDNPDAFLVLLLVLAAYCVTRALDGARMRWLVGAGVAVGFAFLTKSGQALLPVPGFGLAYLIAAPTSMGRRIGHLLASGVAIVVSAGWWIAAVMLWPAADRPYIGGSTDNNPLGLAFGYNGLDRILGGSGNAGGGGGGGRGGFGTNSGFGGATGLQRLFTSEMGLEISWLLPAALLLLASGIWLTWGRKRTDLARAALIVWGGWLVVTAVTFSYMKGTIHPYYTVALAPAIGALVGIGGVLLWQRRAQAGGVVAYVLLGLTVAVTCAWDVKLLRSNSYFHPSTAVITLAVAAIAVVALVVMALRSSAGRRLAAATAVLTGLAVVIPASAWALGTAATPHTGSIPTAVSSSGLGGGGGFGGGGFGGVLAPLVVQVPAVQVPAVPCPAAVRPAAHPAARALEARALGARRPGRAARHGVPSQPGERGRPPARARPARPAPLAPRRAPARGRPPAAGTLAAVAAGSGLRVPSSSPRWSTRQPGGPPLPAARRPRQASSWRPAASQSWPWAALLAATPRRPWPSSRPTSPPATSPTSSPAVRAAPTAADRPSRAGSKPTTSPPRSVAKPSTSCTRPDPQGQEIAALSRYCLVWVLPRYISSQMAVSV